MRKLTILLVLVVSLFTCSNKILSNEYISEMSFESDMNNLLAGEFSIIEEINALSIDEKKSVLALALNIFHEARGESLEGQIAVANVVFNRVRSNLYPNDIINVVYQHKQFSWTLNQDRISNLKKEEKSWIECQKLAFIVYTNHKQILSSNEFYLNYVNKISIDKITWTKDFTKRKEIGSHIFLMRGNNNA